MASTPVAARPEAVAAPDTVVTFKDTAVQQQREKRRLLKEVHKTGKTDARAWLQLLQFEHGIAKAAKSPSRSAFTKLVKLYACAVQKIEPPLGPSPSADLAAVWRGYAEALTASDDQTKAADVMRRLEEVGVVATAAATADKENAPVGPKAILKATPKAAKGLSVRRPLAAVPTPTTPAASNPPKAATSGTKRPPLAAVAPSPAASKPPTTPAASTPAGKPTLRKLGRPMRVPAAAPKLPDCSHILRWRPDPRLSTIADTVGSPSTDGSATNNSQSTIDAHTSSTTSSTSTSSAQATPAAPKAATWDSDSDSDSDCDDDAPTQPVPQLSSKTPRAQAPSPAPAPPPPAAPTPTPAPTPGPTPTPADDAFVVNGRTYRKLATVGRGGSSKVFKVLSGEGAILALKRIRLKSVKRDAIEPYVNEIRILESLRGKPNIIQLVDSEVDLDRRHIHVVMECGEIALSRWLEREKDKVETTEAKADGVVTPAVGANTLRMVWQQMLTAVGTIHDARIVHGDLKPANFVFVEGTLKLIDFGIAKAIGNDTTNIVRDSQVGTINYMSPESLCGTGGGGRLRLGRASDLWSLGCILYQMVYGSTPFASCTNVIRKMQAIVSPEHVIEFPALHDTSLADVLQLCLQREASKRPLLASLLAHPFLFPEALSGLVYKRLVGDDRRTVKGAEAETAALLGGR